MTPRDRAVLVAAKAFASALREQHHASAQMRDAEERGGVITAAVKKHSGACGRLDDAEYHLFRAALIANGWTEKEVEGAI